jgi:hypothetical protein
MTHEKHEFREFSANFTDFWKNLGISVVLARNPLSVDLN